MSQHLQTILNFIQQSEHLSADEKTALLNAAKNADKELEITSFKLEHTEKLKDATAILLQETIEELEQKGKAVEAQKRELEIESALERVRARTMAMHKSDELGETASLLFQQIKTLGIESYSSGFTVWENDDNELVSWMCNADGSINPPFRMPATDIEWHRQQYESWKKEEDYIIHDFTGKEMEDHFRYLRSFPLLDDAFKKSEKAGITTPSRQVHNAFNFSHGNLLFITLQPVPESHDIFKRFAKVFDQTYTRFLDLKKAEAQAREGQIQLALERVRARTMAMQKSDELQEVVHTMLERLKDLNVEFYTAIIILFAEDSKDIIWWLENKEKQQYSRVLVPYANVAYLRDLFETRENEINHFSKTYSFEEKNELFHHLFSATDFQYVPEKQRKFLLESEAATMSVTIAKNTGIHLTRYTDKAFSEEENAILKRFVKVFEQTYTRFLDLQKAEAQARESQIQLALERVRARTMAMQKSDELSETASLLFEQVSDFGIKVWSSAFQIWNDDDISTTAWASAPDGSIQAPFRLPYDEDIFFKKIYESRKNGKDFFVMESSGKELEDTYHYMFNLPGVKKYFDDAQDLGFPIPKYQITHCAFFSNGYLMFITYEACPEMWDIFKRFAKVFEQTYTRFLDLQKAEAQARESQIQLALERVRARTMAMQKSDELSEAVYILFQQFRELGENPDQATIGVINEDEKVIEYWVTMYGNPIDKVFKFSLDEPNVTGKIYKAWKENKRSLVIDLSGDALVEFMTYRAGKGGAAINPDEKRRIINVAFFSKGLLNVQSNEQRSEESIKLLERFASVFEQTYTRFLDLQKVEAQARESQIQLAMERVRARTMAMQKSDELADAASLLFKQLDELGIKSWSSGFNIWEDDGRSASINMCNPDGSIATPYHLPHTKNIFFKKIYEARQRGDDFLVMETGGKELEETYQYMFSLPEVKKMLTGMEDTGSQIPKFQVNHCAFFSQGYLMFITYEPVPEMWDIFKRFAKVFEQTYTRFLDLQKAEAQAREAEIQLALERVRARTMAMQKQNDLLGVLDLLVDQLVKLGVNLQVANFSNGIPGGDWDLWIEVAADDGTIFNNYVHFPRIDHPYFHHVEKNIETFRKDGADLFKDVFSKEEKDSWQDYINTQTIYKDLTSEEIKQVMYEKPGYAWSMVILKDAWVSICRFDIIPFTEAEDALLRRFANAFGQAYTRFLDLQKAEAQAREAEIQLALERVRSRAMAMQNSEELNGLIGTVFTELTRLDLVLTRCIIQIYDPKTNDARWWMANSETPNEPMNFLVQYHEYPANMAFLKAWQERSLKWMYTLEGQTKKDWDDFLFTETELSKLPDFVIAGMRAPEKVYLNASFNTFGNLILASLEPLSDEQFDIMLRFAKVFDLSYTRFNDLKQAEVQAREAIKQASVDRVRAEIASMRSTKDLERITPLIWNELNVLGVPFIRCGVFIVNEEKEMIQTYLSTPGGQAIAAFTLPFDAEGIGKTVLYNWRNNQPVTIHWTEEEFKRQSMNLVSQGAIESEEKYLTDHPPTSLDLHFFPFLQGMLYAGNTEPLSDNEKSLVQSLADAFATAYARYEDFNKLEEAKGKIETTLTELKATQTQLIQSEKMASLGELTAGIAHEIQNPLNFVNNFSEVNTELIDELKLELATGNQQMAMEIADDIKTNEEKINHHGKRADAIVKGMLQHSRSSTGVKEPTDINALADEYLRLAYHGFRAKDKSFNAAMKTGYDTTLEKVNIIPQDIGRVILNLITNAFYAINEKAKQQSNGYEPTISLSTKKSGDTVFLSVKDNGGGIPQKVLDKIFQPFFTTKPTGEGTGLGLSLSYDIIKAHGGELKVNSIEGEFTEFVIQLPV